MKVVKGNIFDLAEQGEFDVVVHGCNCFCTMGKGIAYPKIGAGLAGGDWNTISAIIDEELEGEDHTLVLL